MGKNKIDYESIYSNWNNGVDKAFGEKKGKERVITFFTCVLGFLISLMFTFVKLPFTDFSLENPLSFAFVTSCRFITPFAYMGAIYGEYLLKKPTIMSFTYLTLSFLLRIIISKFVSSKEKDKLFYESPLLKTGNACVISMTASLVHILQKGMYEGIWYKLLGTLIPLPVITFLFSVFFEGYPKSSSFNGRQTEKVLYEISLIFMFSVLVYGAKDIRYLGASLSSLIAVNETLITAKKGGYVRGGIYGLILGTIASGKYGIAMGVMGFAGGVFYELGILTAAGTCCIFAGITAVILGKYEAVFKFIPDAVIGIAIASPIIKYEFMPKNFPFPLEIRENPEGESQIKKDMIMHRGENAKLRELSTAFYDLATSINNFDKTVGIIKKSDGKEICERLQNGFCDSCPLSPICWESEKTTCENDIKEYFENRVKTDFKSKTTFGGYIESHCINKKALENNINEMIREMKIANKNDESGNGYIALSEILTDAAKDSEEEYVSDKQKEKAVFKAANAMGIHPETVSVIGKKRKKIYAYGVDPEKIPVSFEKLRENFSEICGYRLEKPYFNKELGNCMVLTEAENFTIDFEISKETKEGEKVSGDTAFTFGDDKGNYYAVIADGMGSGEEAAECSAMVSLFLEKLLKCSVNKAVIVKTLENIIKKRFKECFSTVDILQIDMVSGKGEFLKSGAAASYVVRGGGVYCINSCSMPIGIMEEATPVMTEFDFKDGDKIIMVSDGIAQIPTENNKITDIISSVSDRSEKEIGAYLIKKAKETKKYSDDMTCIVGTVKNKEISTQSA